MNCLEIECDVYRSSTKEHLYLFVKAGEGMVSVPQDLLLQFGQPEKALSVVISPDRVLAKEDPELVAKNLLEQGYHLQLPPADKRFV